LRAIARQRRLARQTVCRFAHAEVLPERVAHAHYPSIAGPYEPYLRQCWDEGCQNAAQHLQLFIPLPPQFTPYLWTTTHTRGEFASKRRQQWQ
jgi:hypothetical protein